MTRRSLFARLAAPALVLCAAGASVAAPTAPTALARETLALMASLDGQLVAAVRQRDTRGGRDDFSRFIIAPLARMSGRWSDLPNPARIEWLDCISALQAYENHARDSFKSGEIGKAPADLSGARRACAKRAGVKL